MVVLHCCLASEYRDLPSLPTGKTQRKGSSYALHSVVFLMHYNFPCKGWVYCHREKGHSPLVRYAWIPSRSAIIYSTPTTMVCELSSMHCSPAFPYLHIRIKLLLVTWPQAVYNSASSNLWWWGKRSHEAGINNLVIMSVMIMPHIRIMPWVTVIDPVTQRHLDVNLMHIKLT